MLRVAVSVVLAAAAAAQDAEPAARLRAGEAVLELAAGGRLAGEVEAAVVGAGGIDLRARGARVTFAPDAALGVKDDRSFTVTAELRIDDGAFATAVMCRRGSAVHYSLIVGREPGVVTFEPWSWARDKLPSRTRLDDGAWHEVVGSYDAATRTAALVVDGEVHATAELSAGFAGSPAPALRFGNNLDPSVDQPFRGAIRRFELCAGVHPAVRAAIAAARAAAVLTRAEVDAALSAWLRDHVRPRPPMAASADEWRRRARRIRALVQDAVGLWPPPYGDLPRPAGGPTPLTGLQAEATDFARFAPSLPLDVREGGQLERDGVTVTRLYWQSFAGYWASGWLWLPQAAADAPRPAVLCPHGHWAEGARSPVVQARCIALARQGYVVLAPDSVHLGDARVGLSPLSVMTQDNLRALEYLRGRADVDPARIACTGASGGGQQTYYLTALDAGLCAAAPVVMAAHFAEILLEDQVHCWCNHTPHLLRAADMPEMAAAFAPRPQLFASVTGDWTRRFPEHGFPEVRAVYGLFGAGDRVSAPQWDQGHGYDRPQREAVYAFFAHAVRGVDERPREPDDLRPYPPEQLAALDRDRPPHPAGAIVAEFRDRLAAPPGRPVDAVVASLRALLLADGEATAARVRPLGSREVAGRQAEAFAIAADGHVELPALLLRPAAAPRRLVVVLGERDGKAGVLQRRGEDLDALLAGGCAVLLADVRYLGELDRGRAWRDPYGRMLGRDEGVLAVRDLAAVLTAAATLPGLAELPRAVLGYGDSGAVAVLAAAVDPRIAVAAAPRPGPRYRDADRAPGIARILLCGDLDDAARAVRAVGRRVLEGDAAVRGLVD